MMPHQPIILSDETMNTDRAITKEGIFHYTYAVLHNPRYRDKYALNLKRDFPRIPFYPDFHYWRDQGKTLMSLHIDYEMVTPFGLERIETDVTPKTRLKADKIAGTIDLDGATILTGIPAIVWTYKLGSRSALEWVLDQHKERRPKDPMIAAHFNTYRFAGYKEHVIDLLQRVCAVSVETMKILIDMEREPLTEEEVDEGLIHFSFGQERAFRLIKLRLNQEIHRLGEDVSQLEIRSRWEKRYNEEVSDYLNRCELPDVPYRPPNAPGG